MVFCASVTFVYVFAVNKTTEVSDFTKAIQAKNLKKFDAEAEKKRGREDTQQNKSKNLFSFSSSNFRTIVAYFNGV